jgi:hypothetical protein
MKKLILSLFIVPFAGKAGFNSAPPSPNNLFEIRSGDWPIVLEKSGTSYSLQFRDMQVLTDVVMDTLPFPDLSQLKYFEKALSVLKTAKNGDIAKFKDYSIKRADKKYEGVWYILRIKWGLTDFRQSEADIMINTIRGL